MARAVKFYKSAFGAIEVYRKEDPGGSVVDAIRWRRSLLFLAGGRGQQILLNLLNQKWQIGRRKTQARCRQAMMFDVGWNVFMMRMSADKRGIVGMWLRIVPVKFFRAAPDFVAVADDLQHISVKH